MPWPEPVSMQSSPFISDDALFMEDTPGITLGASIAVLLAAKRSANYRPRYVKSLRLYLGAFARGREDTPLSDIKVETVELWFAGRNEAPSTQRGNFGRLCALFSFAERREWIVKSPMRMMDRIRVDAKPPKILTVDQCQRLMEFVMYRHPRALAFISLALFGGIRPEELRKVSWASVGQGIVTVDAAASKVRRRRIVHLRENAVEWIEFAREVGAMLPITLNGHVMILKRAAKHLGFTEGWPQDILRHTGASMWLAVSKDVGSVSKELGNSPAILLTNYQELVSSESALAFWAIRP